jgi:hypothetical protein
MTSNQQMPRVPALIASLLVWGLALASPARAAIAVDFNGDGVLDSVQLPRPPETNIVVNVSGFRPQILKLSSRLVSIVVTDVDHDGDLDVSALSERRGVYVWVNKLDRPGKRGKGRFSVLKTRRVPHWIELDNRPIAAAAERDGSDRVASQAQGDPTAPNLPRGRLAFAPPDVSQRLAPSQLLLTSEAAGATDSRGPPLPTA